jgi:hypothetical protein
VLPYDSSHEKLPSYAYYHPDFQSTEVSYPAIIDEFLGAYEEVKAEGYYDGDISRICDDLRQLAEPEDHYPPIKPVACFGPAGVGKSSAINCLLDQQGTAIESDSNRGTNLVHEFRKYQPRHMSKYVVTACYRNDKQIEILVNKHCEGIFLFLNESDECDEEDRYDEMQKNYSTGVELFQTLLCDHSEFMTDDDAREYFEEHADEPSYVIADLNKRIRKFKASRELEDDVETLTAENNKELLEIYKSVSRGSDSKRNRKPHPWPIVLDVKVHLDHRLLNSGVVIADTPGMNDTNSAVVDATTTYIENAGTVLVFENFKRIKQSKTLTANLRKLIELKKTQNIYLIVTGIDVATELKDVERDDFEEEEMKTLEQAEAAVGDLERHKTDLRQRRRVLEAEGKADDISSQLEKMPDRIALAEAKVSQLIIQHKTRMAESQLKGMLRSVGRSKTLPDLQVLFLSSTQYQKHRKGYDPSKPPVLTVEATGVAAIRAMLYGVPIRGKASTLKRICLYRLPTFFGGIRGILNKAPIARKAEIVKAMRKVLSRRARVVEFAMENIKGSFN